MHLVGDVVGVVVFGSCVDSQIVFHVMRGDIAEYGECSGKGGIIVSGESERHCRVVSSR